MPRFKSNPATQVINQVAAAAIGARLDCDAFAATHSATSHYDRVRHCMIARAFATQLTGALPRVGKLCWFGLETASGEHLLR
jgi:hypothetical protein